MPGAEILLVEDDEVLSGIVGRNLRARGHAMSVAPDMQSALAALRAHDFDLVVLDINLPDQTGWEVLREAQHEGTLHSHELDGNKLPVVVLSAVQVSPRRLAEFRPVAYLPKPFPLDSLLRRPRSAKSVRLRPERKTPIVRLVHYQMRRNSMLDAIIILVTIITFVAFIGFTEACERL